MLISVTPTFASKWLISNLPDFTATHPSIDLRIVATERVSSFYSDGIDLAVRQGNPPFGAAIEAHLLFRQDIVAVASPSSCQHENLPLTRDALYDMRKIHDTHRLWPRFLDFLSICNSDRRGLQLSQTALSIDAAIAGQGVALASRFLVQKDIETGNLVQVVPEVLRGEGDFYLLSRRSTGNRSAVVSVVDWLRQFSETS
ncbi:LysR substrate-binding domain-containing protein [Ruegeria atlantica]|uniref:LysR substrate-binding domain-containing protein n=1 Tax=Ruegeria atlantica TaxID=81569 RepID=UPI0034A00D1D